MILPVEIASSNFFLSQRRREINVANLSVVNLYIGRWQKPIGWLVSDGFAVTDLHGGVYRKEKCGDVCAGLTQPCYTVTMDGADNPGFFCDDPRLQRLFTKSLRMKDL